MIITTYLIKIRVITFAQENTMKYLCKIILLISLVITLFTPNIFAQSRVAQERGNLSASLSSELIDFSSIPSGFKFFYASLIDNMYQLNFKNNKTNQRVSFTFGKDMKAKSEYEYKVFTLVGLKAMASEKRGRMKNEPVAIRKIRAHNQDVFYYLVEQYMDGRQSGPAIMGAINNYNGKFIVIQSWGDDDTFSEQDAINFFKKVNFYTQNF